MILCSGEALIDMIQSDTSPAFTPHPGGAVFNTAIALGRLGVPTAFYNDLADDFFGDLLRQSLRDAHVDDHLCQAVSRPCTLAFAQIRDGAARYTFYDRGSAGRETRVNGIADLPTGIETAFFGGISLIYGPSAESYEQLCTALAPRMPVMIDPNIRPGFIEEEASYRARLQRLFAKADIIKLSDEDLAWLIPTQTDQDAGARLLQAQNNALILITRGGAQVTAYKPEGAKVEVQPDPVAIADTVGAGDTFNAGILAGLRSKGMLSKQGIVAINETTLHDIIAFATRAAAITVSRPGANPPWAHEIDMLLD